MTETGAPHDVRVAVLGLGAMGLPMAGRLATRFPVRAFDVDAGRRALAADAGAEAADGVAEAVRGATAVLVAVRTEEQLRGLLLGPDGAVAALEPGAVVIVTSTVGRPALEALAGPVAEAGAGVVDAPLSGGPVRAGRGDLLVLLSGAPAHVAAARPVVDALGSTVTVVGERPGDGQAVKTVNQLLCGVHIAAAAEALALARALGLEGESVLAALQSGAASSFMLGDRGPRMLQAWDDEGAEVRSRLDIFTKDLGIVGAATRSLGLPSPVAAAAEQLFLIGQARGLGSLDDSAVIRVLAEDGS